MAVFNTCRKVTISSWMVLRAGGLSLKGGVAFDSGLGYPVDSVFLHLPRRHLRNAKVAEKGEKMQPKADAMSLDPAWAPLAFGDNSIFLDELIRRLAEGLFRCEKPRAVFPA